MEDIIAAAIRHWPRHLCQFVNNSVFSSQLNVTVMHSYSACIKRIICFGENIRAL